MIVSAAGPDPGGMAAVSVDRSTVAEAVRDIDGVVLANQNSSAQTVIVGPSDAISAALATLKQRGLIAKDL